MFYGWRIVAVVFLTHFISVGFLFYSYGAVFKAIAADFGGSRLGVGIGLTLTQVVTAAIAPFLGRALEGGVRRVMCLGAIVMACGFLLVTQIGALWQFYAVLGGFIALGSAMLGGLPGSTLVSNWFVQRRGTALGIATIGISLSGFVMAPVATWLLAAFGWRHTFLLYGIGALLLVLPVWLVVVDRPEDLGLAPDGGEDPPPARASAMSGPAIQLPPAPSEPLRDRNFWVLTLVVAGNFSANGALLTHLIPFATDVGFSPTRAAFLLSALAGFGTLGKPMFGWLTDHASKRAGLWLASALQACGVAGLLAAESYPALMAAVSVFGLGMGGLVPLWGAALGAAFGRRAFGRIMGLMSLCMLPIQSIGVPFAGWVHDRYGSYQIAFSTFLLVYLVAGAFVGLLNLPGREPE